MDYTVLQGFYIYVMLHASTLHQYANESFHPKMSNFLRAILFNITKRSARKYLSPILIVFKNQIAQYLIY